ncbi:ABC-three component system middle component 1 [uncultured Pontibacter sp.]|uniref:ABC-three component system middle component 1 n=1 Tax=uncultured Pontibacter sp. TaxID=453356 RepID=UPI002629AF04|nr:ABC-three component system middle component 1 [uncultured Pontibacter sp.]
MKIEELKYTIINEIKDRYLIETESKFSTELQELAIDNLRKDVLRIQRLSDSNEQNLSTWKTLLIVNLVDKTDLKCALKWASMVQDSLLDPETADLYLFLFFNEPLTQESCLRIESTEQFCRKYVLRPNETLEQLLERSFLSKLENSRQELIELDPLHNAFLYTGSKYAWFDADEQTKWKDAFLSNLTGGDLIEKIFAIDNQQK